MRAAATDTCWPTITRTPSSKPSAQPGLRKPGPRGHERRERAVLAEL